MEWILLTIGVGLGVCLWGAIGEWLWWRRERQEASRGHYIVVPMDPSYRGQKQALVCTYRACALLGLPQPRIVEMLIPGQSVLPAEAICSPPQGPKP